MTKARPDYLLAECQGCWKRRPLTYMRPLFSLGLYCWRCRLKIEDLAATANREPKKRYYPGLLPGEPPKEVPKHAPHLVRWWDSKNQEYRWVAKRSKPELKPSGRRKPNIYPYPRD